MKYSRSKKISPKIFLKYSSIFIKLMCLQIFFRFHLCIGNIFKKCPVFLIVVLTIECYVDCWFSNWTIGLGFLLLPEPILLIHVSQIFIVGWNAVQLEYVQLEYRSVETWISWVRFSVFEQATFEVDRIDIGLLIRYRVVKLLLCRQSVVQCPLKLCEFHRMHFVG